MSWLSIPLPNPFKQSDNNQQESQSLSEGLREELSFFTETIGKQLRGVASFLSPPPPQPQNDVTLDSSSSTSSSSPGNRNLVGGIKNDLVEIGGSFKSLLLSDTKAVSEISKFASNLLHFDSDEDNDSEPLDQDVGITDEVVDFVKEISTGPECWTDFPLSFNNDFIADFSMSDIQREHASVIEQLIPNLQALRLKLRTQISEKQFWIIYFILLLPRLNEHDSKLLSTTEIVEARDALLQKLHNKRHGQMDDSEDFKSQRGSIFGDIEEEEISPIQEKQVLAETVNAVERLDKHENIAPWFEDEDSDTGASSNAQKRFGNEEDVSFSDLEDDDENDTNLSSHQSCSRLPESKGELFPSGSSDWVQLSEISGSRIGQIKAGQITSREKDSEGEESNDWLTVDDVDSDSPAVV